MAYGLKYRITFRNRQYSNGINDVYIVEIWQKDYLGNTGAFVANESPFILKYQSGDDSIPFTIRASECEVHFYNEGATPLSTFYSEDDEEYRIDFYCYSIEDVVQDKLLWSGYVVQDNCQEEFAFPSYVIKLSATDNLGLLKEVPLNVAFNQSPKRTLYESGNDDVVITNLDTIAIQLPLIIVSQDLTKMQVLIYDEIEFTIVSASYDSGTNILTLTVAEEFAANGSFAGKDYAIYSTANIFGKVSLYDIFTISLSKTGIALPLNVYSNLYENTMLGRGDSDTATFLEQTFIQCTMFQNDDGTWQDCYSILDKLLFTFNATLFQAEGSWNLVRFPEAIRFTDNKILGTAFPADLVSTPSTTALDPNILIDKDGQIIEMNSNQITRINRPYKDVKLTFNYHQPKNLIRNINMDEKGALINSFTDGDGNLVREYELPYWFETGNPGQPDVFLRVISSPVVDSVDEIEIERYIVLSGGTFGGPFLTSSSFYLDENDRVTVSFQFRTSDSNTGASNITFLFVTDDGADLYKINFNNGTTLDGSWSTVGGAVFSLSASDDLNEWATFTVDSLSVPVSGYFYIQLDQADSNGPVNETHYKDIRVDYHPYINRSSQVIGQYHLQHQSNSAKNVFDEEIFFDDSPKHAVSGTLFTGQVTGDDYITLTTLWHLLDETDGRKLGQITSFERKLLSFIARTVVEGDFLGLRYTKDSAIRYISLLNIFQIGTLTDKNFVFGLVTFDYMSAIFSATLWELYKIGDTDEFEYTFKYISQVH